MKSSRGFFKLLFLMVVLGCITVGYLMYTRYGAVSFVGFEKTPPRIDTVQEPIGVGSERVDLAFSVYDDGAGLDEVVVRIEQNGKVHDLIRKRYDAPTHSDTVQVSFIAREKDLKEGDATIKISVFDKSFFSNGSTRSFASLIEYSKPRVEVLTGQHNVAVGGVELVFYRLKGSPAKRSGVQVGEIFFEGNAASQLHPGFEKHPDIYFAFFALPYNFKKERDKIAVIVESAVGNRGNAPIPFLVIPRKYKDVEMKLTDTFLQKVFDELLPLYYSSENITEPPLNLIEIRWSSREVVWDSP